MHWSAPLYLIVVHGDIKFIVEFESQAPYDPPEPQTVVAVHWLRLGRNVQDVFALVQGTHVLTYTRDTGPGCFNRGRRQKCQVSSL